MKRDKNIPDRSSQKESLQAGDSGLAIGLSLGILVGLLIDDLGLGMMLGAAAGLCSGPSIGALRKKKSKKSKGQ